MHTGTNKTDNAWELRADDTVTVSRCPSIPSVPCRVQSSPSDGIVHLDPLYKFPELNRIQLPQDWGQKYDAVPLGDVSRVFQTGDPVILTDREISGKITSLDLESSYRRKIGATGIVLCLGDDDGIPMLGIGVGPDNGPSCWLWAPAWVVHPYHAYAEVPALALLDPGSLFALPDDFVIPEEPEPEVQIDMEDPPLGAMILAKVGLSVVVLVAILGWKGDRQRGVWTDVTTGDPVRALSPVRLRTLFVPEMVLAGDQ